MKTTEKETVIDVPTKEITTRSQQAEVLVIPSQYDRLIESGFNSNADLDRMERLFELKKLHEENEARKAYHAAMAEFKKETIVLTKDKKNTQYGSMYTTIGNLVNTVAPLLGIHGLSHKWDIMQNDKGIIKVTCIATHSLGHSDSVPMISPPDVSGKKNPIQQIKSTITYLKSATFESLFGLASTDGNIDDDGNGANSIKYINENQEADLIAMLTEKNVPPSEVLKMFNINKLEDLTIENYKRAVKLLKDLN